MISPWRLTRNVLAAARSTKLPVLLPVQLANTPLPVTIVASRGRDDSTEVKNLLTLATVLLEGKLIRYDRPEESLGFNVGRVTTGGPMEAANTHADIEVNFFLTGTLRYLYVGSMAEAETASTLDTANC